MMAPKKKQTLRITVIGGICAALLAIFAFTEKANSCIDSRIEKVTKKYVEQNLERDLKIMIEFNRQQAMDDSVKFVQWNRAIDIVDNAGKIK